MGGLHEAEEYMWENRNSGGMTSAVQQRGGDELDGKPAGKATHIAKAGERNYEK
jgi:hypothetical protein